ncbi:zinc finger homeobox protein 2 isoform X2 [Rana temporaria]|uniref:zinc finger homeobox protein 2 isoform X2 n=1 Tax=Rana temporaria TaxID=8407 RepID=UPI001AAD07D0|nr:zinc finger homeobox protein 2 isoform X2 [Rana temporaria]
MDAGECFLPSSGQDERSPWPLDLNLPLCPTTTKDTPLLPPNPSPEFSSSSTSVTGGGYGAASPTSSMLQMPLLTPSSPHPTYLPKLSSPLQPNCKEETEDGGEALVGHVLFASDGTVYLLKGEEGEDGALPSPSLPQDSPKSTVTTHPPLTSFRLTATYQGFCSNQISRHTSAEAANLTQTAPGTSPRTQDQPKEKEAGGKQEEEDIKYEAHRESTKLQRVDGTWICLPCRLNFHTGIQLGWHASRFHGLEHPYKDQLASGETSGIIHRSGGQIFISLLEPKRSQNVLDAGQEPENVVLSRVQTTPSSDVIQSMPEKSGTSEDLVSNTNPSNTKSQGTFQGNPDGNPKLSMGLVPNSPLSYHKCDPTGNPHSTEAKDSKALVDEKTGVANWCSATEAVGEDAEEEEEDVAEGSLPVSQPSDINEQLLANQSFYGPMITNSFIQMGALHGIDKVGNQTDADRGPLAHDECTPTSGPQPFQSLSLQGQLSLLHSRNSCKTLKCPKCNWHYKYQQTLDVHMKEKHPESHSHCSYCHNGQQHPRLARGESYNCGYKPYRCEACNYSTTTKGNLTIHMQSDKHLANLQGYQGSGPTPTAAVAPLAAQTVNAGQGDPNQTSPIDRQLKQKASWHCKVCNYETNISRNLRIHMTSEKHMQNVLLLHQGLGMSQDNFPFYGGPLAPEQTLDHPLLFNPMHFSSSSSQACSLLPPDSPSGPQVNALSTSGMTLPAPPPLPEPSPSFPEEEISSGVFRCLVCRCYTTDSLEALLSHASRGRSLPEREWREVRGDLHCCRLCSYSTQLKANFQLHLKTDKHAQKYQLAAHMREGGAALATAQASAAELPISGYSQASSFPPLHLRCNLCGYESNSREKIQLHVQGGGHEESLRVYKFLQVIEGSGGSDAGFRCAPCDSTVGSRLGMMSHLRTAIHHQNITQWRLVHGEAILERIVTVCRSQQEHVKIPNTPEITSASDTGEDNTDIPQAPVQDETSKTECEKAAEGTTVFCCPFCAYVSPSEEKVNSHAVSQHALQPTFRCPLCQEQLTGTSNLKAHLGHGHNVMSECVEKLLQVAQKVHINFRTRIIPVKIIEEPEQSSLEILPSSEATDTSPPESPGEISTSPNEATDSVADTDKLPEETACPLCPITSENSQELRTHLEKDHPEFSQSDIQQACESRSQEVEGTEQEDKKGPQESTPAHTQHSIYRKTTNFAMDKFMDPSRPHKCVVCKESFTQKNILLVHYNSVSHLHKVRKASLDPSLSNRHESGAGSTVHGVQAGQDKPYKCTVCHVSYNQSSTLEIHMRSVLHQTRSRSLKQDPTKIPLEKPQRDPVCKSETTTDCRGETIELQGVDLPKKRPQQIGPCVGVPILPSPVAPPPVQLSMDLSRPPPLVQPSPLFTSSLLPSFPLIPEAFLKLQRQQQQLLLPFYLQELKVSADGGPTPLLSFGGAQQPPSIKDEGDQPSVTPRPANEKDEKVPDEREAATGEADVSQNPESSTKASVDPTGSAARALLENFGFELVTQYNEGRQPLTSQIQIQPQPPAPPLDALPIPDSTESLQCGTCGKHFSNRLILKTHEEHMHQRLLPFEALSRYAANYRRTYDSHNPAGVNTETGGPSATPLDFSVTSQHSQCSKEVEDQDSLPDQAITVEQLRFLHNHLDFPGHLLEEQLLWAAEKTGLSPAAIMQWHKQGEGSMQEFQEEEGEDYSKTDRMSNRRFSRTKFSDFQTQALNSFFESSAYPRDNEVEQLSALLGLSGRVVVVWFQNARQKARKQAADYGNSPSPPLYPVQPGERPAANSNVPPCRKCGMSFPCIFHLIRHLKTCYSDISEEATETEEKDEELIRSAQTEESVSDHTEDTDLPLSISQEKQDKPQKETKVDQEVNAPVIKEKAESPKVNEGNIPISEPGDHLVEPNESSVTNSNVDQNQNKTSPSNSHLQTPLMDLSVLIPVGPGEVAYQRKRKHEEESLSPTGSEGGDEPPRDKRLRTTILPEQLDILHRWYLQDSNPTRSTLERISFEVGLKKRVVQVWFQNTRARERKGQYRGVPPGTISAPRQQDDSTNEATKRESSGSSYFYNATPSQIMPQLVAKSCTLAIQTSSSVSSKPQTSSSLTNTHVAKSLVNPTQALSGLLSAAQIMPGLVNPSQTIPSLASSSQALAGLVNPPQTLSGLVNPNQAFPGLINPAHVLPSLVSTSQSSPGLLLASFQTKPAAPPVLVSSPPEAKVHSSPIQQAPSQLPIAEPDKTVTLSVNETLDCSKIKHSEQHTTENQSTENQGSCNQKPSEEKTAHKMMDSMMHSPQAGDMSDSSSSDPGPSSPGKGPLNSEGFLGSSGARRYRTQMSSLQLRILKACYSEYRTPSMQECDCLGSEIGLQKRVVQVWFQNARAKEKKAKLQGLVGTTASSEGPQPTECTHCNVKYGPTIPCRAHIFSRQHIARLRVSIQQQLKEESRYRDTHPSAGAPSVSESKPTSQMLNFQTSATVAPQIQRITPLLMPGQGIPAPIGGLATFNTGCLQSGWRSNRNTFGQQHCQSWERVV